MKNLPSHANEEFMEAWSGLVSKNFEHDQNKKNQPCTYHCPCGKIHEISAEKFLEIKQSGITPNGDSHYTCECSRVLNIYKIWIN